MSPSTHALPSSSQLGKPRLAAALPTGRIFAAQVMALTRANLKARYRGTVAGFVWVVMNPIILFASQSYAFKHVLRIQAPNYSLFLLSALLPWIFFVQSLEMCTSLFVTMGRAIRSFPMHPLVYLSAQLFDNAINFLAAFALVLVPVWILEPGEARGLLFLPIAILLLWLGVFGASWLFATLQVFYRDTRYMVSFVISWLFFVTPVFYPADFVPTQWRFLVVLNPVHRLIQPFRIALYEFSYGDFWRAALAATLVGAGSLGIAALFWRLKRNDVYISV